MDDTQHNDFFDRFKLLMDDANGNFGDRFADSVPALVFVVDANRRKLKYINQQVTNVLGYTHADLTGWDYDVTRFFFKDDLESVQKEIEKLYNLNDQDVHSYNARYNLKNDQFRYFKTSASILKRGEDGKPASLLFIAQDITDKVKSEIELQSLQELLQESEELLHYGLYEWDFIKNTLSRSDGVYKIYGMDKSDPLHRISINDSRNEEDNERIEGIIQQAIKDRSSFEFEFSYNRGEETLWIQNKGKIVVPPNGEQPHRIIGIVIDRTRQKHHENTLQKTLADLKRSNKELEEFAYVASHDLQEPLRKINTFGQILSSRYESALGAEGKALLARMGHATDNMRILIDNLLEFSRSSQSRHPFQKADLNTVMEEVKDNLEIQPDNKDIVLKVAPLPVIECIPSQMQQLFNNLLSNSIKFRKPGIPCIIDIQCKPAGTTDIHQLHLPASKKYYHISVTDNGIGFEQEYAQLIFQLFQRLHGKSEYAGAGMGLSICKKITDRHNGHIYANSIINEGATFHIILPENQ